MELKVTVLRQQRTNCIHKKYIYKQIYGYIVLFYPTSCEWQIFHHLCLTWSLKKKKIKRSLSNTFSREIMGERFADSEMNAKTWKAVFHLLMYSKFKRMAGGLCMAFLFFIWWANPTDTVETIIWLNYYGLFHLFQQVFTTDKMPRSFKKKCSSHWKLSKRIQKNYKIRSPGLRNGQMVGPRRLCAPRMFIKRYRMLCNHEKTIRNVWGERISWKAKLEKSSVSLELGPLRTAWSE